MKIFYQVEARVGGGEKRRRENNLNLGKREGRIEKGGRTRGRERQGGGKRKQGGKKRGRERKGGREKGRKKGREIGLTGEVRGRVKERSR